MTLRLSWIECRCPIFGKAFRLEGLPNPDDCGSAYKSGRNFVAHAWIGGRYMNHHGSNRIRAIRNLCREIDRRSIGLFGVDVVFFSLISRFARSTGRVKRMLKLCHGATSEGASMKTKPRPKHIKRT